MVLSDAITKTCNGSHFVVIYYLFHYLIVTMLLHERKMTGQKQTY